MTRDGPMPALELGFRLQALRMLAAQIKDVPADRMMAALKLHAVSDPVYDAVLLQIFQAAQTGLAALDRLERNHPLKRLKRAEPPPLPIDLSKD